MSQVAWASGTPSVASISSPGGLASGVSPGTTVITASLSGVTSPNDTLMVTPASLQSIAVTPSSPSIAKGTTLQFTATGTYSDSTTQNLTSQVTWTSGTPSVATALSSHWRPLRPAWRWRTSSDHGGSLGGVTSPNDTLTVTAAALQSIAVTRRRVRRSQREPRFQFTATGTYSDSTTQNLTSQVTWASGTPLVASISSPGGLASGLSVGTTVITASLSGVTSPNDTLMVTPAAGGPIDSGDAVRVRRSQGTSTVQFTAIGTYSDSTTQNLTSQVTWASGTPSVATISSPGGLATGAAMGTSVITASLSGVTSPNDTLTVTAAALQSIAVTPSSPSIAKGTTVQFTAIGTYSDSTTQNLTSQVTWASGTPSVATITSPGGLATGDVLDGDVGDHGVVFSSGVTSPNDTLTVTAAALQSIAVTPSSPSIAKGTTVQFTAIGTYSDSTTQNLTSQVTWASGTPSVATISSPGGLATGVAMGTSVITASLSGVTSPNDTLTVTMAAPTITVNAVSVQWGSQTAALFTASDGVRLLPAGRTTDLPWFNINQIAVTLSQSATVQPGDVSVMGVMGGNYGPVTIAGSGTTNLIITLAKPIASADLVTLTIGNAQVITYTRRLDVLPGDVDDNDAVNTTDGVLILNNTTPVHSYQIFDDMNGDGAVSMADFTTYRPKIATSLPVLSPQLATGGEGPGGAPLLTQAELAPVLSAAIQRWAAAGLPTQDVALLRGVSIEITDLQAGYLGSTDLGSKTIELSADAAGYGWFTNTNATFGREIAATELLASPSSPAAGHEDLLTVLMHELGHTLGVNDLNSSQSSADLMAETLPTGVRRLPSDRDVSMVTASQAATSAVSTHAARVDAVLGTIHHRTAHNRWRRTAPRG